MKDTTRHCTSKQSVLKLHLTSTSLFSIDNDLTQSMQIDNDENIQIKKDMMQKNPHAPIICFTGSGGAL